MLHFLHAFSREVAENTPISSAIKGWTCVFVALSGNYSLKGRECGKIFSFLVAIACQSVGAISEARRASAFGRSVAYPGLCPLLSGLSFWTRHKTLIRIGFPDFRLNRTKEERRRPMGRKVMPIAPTSSSGLSRGSANVLILFDVVRSSAQGRG